jgi:hypothetical protein
MTPDPRPPRWLELHPLLWAVYPILFLYARAFQEVPVTKIFVPLGAALFGAALTWGLGAALFRRDVRKGACLATVLLILFFSFGRIVDLADRFFEATGLWPNLGRMQLATRTLSLQAAVLAVFVALAGAVVVRLALRKPLSAKVPRFFAVPAAILIVVAAGQIAVGLLSFRGGEPPNSTSRSVPPAPRGPSPDIYIVVVDAYAREDVLRDHYGYDNGPFLEALAALGFSVPPQSSANYPMTFLSLASTLNMTSLEDLARETGPGSRDQRRAHEMIRNNRVMAFLKSRGYRTIHLASPWSGTSDNPYADEVWGDRAHVMDDDFTRALINSSLCVINSSRFLEDMAQFHLQQFELLEAAAEEPGPKMVFSHFLLPHHPYVFDRNGAVVPTGSFVDNLLFRKAQWRRTDAYIEQLRFLNARLLAAFRSILGSSAASPIIVLFSDHGPLAASPDPEAAKRAQLDNLVAARLPGAPADLLPQAVRLVNLFPLILNRYFRAGFTVRESSRFFSSFERPYDWELVTSGTEPGPFAGPPDLGVSARKVPRRRPGVGSSER